MRHAPAVTAEGAATGTELQAACRSDERQPIKMKTEWALDSFQVNAQSSRSEIT
jgi:hypothetical protein